MYHACMLRITLTRRSDEDIQVLHFSREQIFLLVISEDCAKNRKFPFNVGEEGDEMLKCYS